MMIPEVRKYEEFVGQAAKRLEASKQPTCNQDTWAALRFEFWDGLAASLPIDGLKKPQRHTATLHEA